MTDRSFRIIFPPVLATVLYTLYVILSNWAEPENFSFIFLALEVVTLYAYFEASRFAIRLVDRKKPTWSDWIKIPIQYLLALSIATIPGLSLYALVKQLFIIYKPQNDTLGFYHLASRMLGLSIMTLLVFSVNLTLKYIRLATKKALANEQLKREQTESQFALLKSQVDPHFLFNSLNTLHSLVRGRSEYSETFILSLSDTLRYSLEDKPAELVSLKEEFEVLKKYVFLQEKRFEDAFFFENSLKLNDEPTVYILPLTLLTLVENAVKHNRIEKGRPLHVHLKEEEHYLIISNEKLPKVVENSLGTGLPNLKERYQYFSEKPVLVEEDQESFVVKIPKLYVE